MSDSIRTTAGDVRSTMSAYDVLTPSTDTGAGGCGGGASTGASPPPRRLVRQDREMLVAKTAKIKARFLNDIGASPKTINFSILSKLRSIGCKLNYVQSGGQVR